MPAAPGKKAASDWVLRSLAGRSRRTAGESSSQAMKGAGACSESCCRWWLTPPRSVKAEPRRSKRWLGCEKIDLRALGDVYGASDTDVADRCSEVIHYIRASMAVRRRQGFFMIVRQI